MPGLLSNMFDEQDGGGESSQSTQEGSVSGEADQDVSPTITVEHEAGGTYENPDGSSGEWSSDTTVTLSTSNVVNLGAAGDYDQSDMDGSS